MSNTPFNNETNPQPFDIETVSDLRGLRLFLERYERDILRPIELPAVQSAYWLPTEDSFGNCWNWTPSCRQTFR